MQEKRGRGRPPLQKENFQINAWVSKEELEVLDSFAKTQDVSRSKAIVLLIRTLK